MTERDDQGKFRPQTPNEVFNERLRQEAGLGALAESVVVPGAEETEADDGSGSRGPEPEQSASFDGGISGSVPGAPVKQPEDFNSIIREAFAQSSGRTTSSWGA
jgi:hypothetical protein